MMPNKRRYLTFKTFNAFVGALCFLLLSSPLFILILIINLFFTKGHPFFVQQRYGKDRKIFNIYKFRSYLLGSDKPTLWGRLLRFTSLDELPQLINILKGDMVFIGPRPLSILETDIDLIRQSTNPSSYLIKPGLSGHAQIHYSSSASLKEKAELDAYYVANVSLLFDLKIFLITIFKAVPITIHRK